MEHTYKVLTIRHSDEEVPGALQAVITRGAWTEMIGASPEAETWEVHTNFEADAMLDQSEGVISYTEIE